MAAMEATGHASDTTEQRGLTEQQARDSASNGHGPWRNAGASHMHNSFRKAFFDQFGLISLQQELRRLNHAS